jgi:uncharacterized protein YndB with AHSA1/START domain
MTELTIRRTVPAATERVWRAFTTDELAAWLWPSTWGMTAEVDLRVGGRYRVVSESKGMGVSGAFITVEPTSRLVQTWQWDGEDDETLVTIILEPEGGGTALTIVHERFADEQTRDEHLQGWNDCLDRLAPFLA